MVWFVFALCLGLAGAASAFLGLARRWAPDAAASARAGLLPFAVGLLLLTGAALVALYVAPRGMP